MARRALIMTCPLCNEVTECESVYDPSEPLGSYAYKNIAGKSSNNLCFFKRVRRCSSCKEDFPTIELWEQDLQHQSDRIAALEVEKEGLNNQLNQTQHELKHALRQLDDIYELWEKFQFLLKKHP